MIMKMTTMIIIMMMMSSLSSRGPAGAVGASRRESYEIILTLNKIILALYNFSKNYIMIFVSFLIFWQMFYSVFPVDLVFYVTIFCNCVLREGKPGALVESNFNFHPRKLSRHCTAHILIQLLWNVHIWRKNLKTFQKNPQSNRFFLFLVRQLGLQNYLPYTDWWLSKRTSEMIWKKWTFLWYRFFLGLSIVKLQNGFQEFFSTASKGADVSKLFVVFLSNYKIVFPSPCNFVEWQGNIAFQEPLITKK